MSPRVITGSKVEPTCRGRESEDEGFVLSKQAVWRSSQITGNGTYARHAPQRCPHGPLIITPENTPTHTRHESHCRDYEKGGGLAIFCPFMFCLELGACFISQDGLMLLSSMAPTLHPEYWEACLS